MRFCASKYLYPAWLLDLKKNQVIIVSICAKTSQNVRADECDRRMGNGIWLRNNKIKNRFGEKPDVKHKILSIRFFLSPCTI